MTDHIMLWDVSGLFYRAYHSSNPRYRDGDGEPIGAVEVCAGLIWRLWGRVATDMPTHAVACFDAPGATFRHELAADYKGGRDPARRRELAKQFMVMRALCGLMGLATIEAPGFEADDVIATLTARARKAGIRVTIISSDKDFAQLVEDDHVEIVDAKERTRSREAEVLKKFGVSPALVPHVQALAGDAVDNIHGVPGCGMETAAKLVRSIGTVQEILARPDRCRFPSIRAHISRKPELVLRDLQLATLRTDVPLKFKWAALEAKPIIKDDLVAFMTKLGSGSRIQSIFGFDTKEIRVVEPIKDPLEWWREELIAPQHTVLPDLPQCGYYQRTIHKGGKMVPARIWREPEYNLVSDEKTGMELLRCHLGGVARDPRQEWPRLSMKPISEPTYRSMMREYGPDKQPPDTKPADLGGVKSIPNPRARKKS